MGKNVVIDPDNALVDDADYLVGAVNSSSYGMAVTSACTYIGDGSEGSTLISP